MVNSVNSCSFKGMEDFANQYNHTTKPTFQAPPKNDSADKVEISKPAEEAVKEEAAPIDSKKSEEAQTAEQPKKKRSFFQKARDLYAGMKKMFIAQWEYTKGIAKGAVAGAIGAVAVLGVDAIRNTIKKAPTFSTKGKVAAGAVATVAMGVNIFKAYLNANQKKAEVDHRWRTGHDA